MYGIKKATGGIGGTLGLVKSSESVGGYSYTLNTESVNKVAGEMYEKVKSFLSPTGLMYAWIRSY
ncbi:MAG: hypothetical protein LBT18_03755 [Endomicrobium sp.]|jgi:hypothetical protein|nr:hypothetical protein [Endomicrobium sp.]